MVFITRIYVYEKIKKTLVSNLWHLFNEKVFRIKKIAANSNIRSLLDSPSPTDPIQELKKYSVNPTKGTNENYI